jgi:hypothetical protein
MDPSNGKVVTLQYRVPEPGSFKYVSLSDRFISFFNDIAEITEKKYPRKFLCAYAYTCYRAPPLKTRLRDNILIGIVMSGYMTEKMRINDRELWDGWRKKAKHVFVRPNAFYLGKGMPTLYPHRLAADLKYYVKAGLTLTDYDGCLQCWATQGLNYYVLAKLLWNPNLNVDSIIDDYCANGFGPAAKEIREYFNALEENMDRYACDNIYSQKTFCKILSKATIHRLERILEKAELKTAGNSVVLARIAFLRNGLEYAKARLKSGGIPNSPEVEKFFRRLGPSRAVNGYCWRVYR